jgi:hypothetical protein
MVPLVQKPETVRDLGAVDVQALKTRVAGLSEQVWQLENARKENDFAVFHHTRHIIFRFTPGNHDPEDNYETPAWLVWRSLLEPVMQQAIRVYGFSNPAFSKAMLARLQAGQHIDLHSDGAGSNLRTHKIHVPLVTNPDAHYLCGEQGFHLVEGHAWEVNNIRPHGAVNNGSEDRIHLIFEVFDRAGANGASATG